jgi:hypothetical protein
MGIVSTQIVGIVDIWTKQISDSQIQSNNVPEIIYPRFRLLYKGFNDYQFQSSDGERRFVYGCNGCGKEIRDISILHNFVSPEGMHEILEANCRKDRKYSIERSSIAVFSCVASHSRNAETN